MATEDIIVMGSSILNNPQGYSYDPRGDSNDGVQLNDGENPFESDDVVVFIVEDVSSNGELNSSSEVIGIIVYDSAIDYVNGTAKYTYTLTNSNDGNRFHNDSGEINTGVHYMGDNYLHFWADGITSTDPGAPDLDQLLLAPGIDLSDGFTPTWVSHENDIDYDGDGNITGDEVGDGSFSTDNNVFAEEEIAAAVCLTRGTLIDTPQGPKYIETLEEGDLVNTLDAGPKPIRWIGSRKMPAQGHLAPVLIKAGAMGNIRDLKVSQNHRMLVRGPQAELLFGEHDVLVAAKHLVNDSTIRIVEGGIADYFHMLFDTHQIIFAEACPTESLYPGEQALGTVSKEARGEILEIFPELEMQSTTEKLSRYELKAWEANALRRAS
jgi:hypothetical protein